MTSLDLPHNDLEEFPERACQGGYSILDLNVSPICIHHNMLLQSPNIRAREINEEKSLIDCFNNLFFWGELNRITLTLSSTGHSTSKQCHCTLSVLAGLPKEQMLPGRCTSSYALHCGGDDVFYFARMDRKESHYRCRRPSQQFLCTHAPIL